MSDPVDELVRLLGRLPGVGERTATRHAFFLLASDRDYVRTLGEAIASLPDRVTRCEFCGNWSAQPRCAICEDTRRDSSLLCVVARVPDLVAIERSGTFRGRYFVLHGLLAPLDGIGPDKLPIDLLRHHIERHGVREIVLATPLSVEGEATALYLAQVVRPLGVRISRIASGVPHGGEVEYLDPVTLGRAFDGRREL